MYVSCSSSVVEHWLCDWRIVCSNPINVSCFTCFFNFLIFKLAITFFSGFEGSTNFHILMHMSIRSYHINKNSGASWSLFLILLSKSHIFSPKKLRFFSVKIFWWVLSTFQWYHSGPLLSAVLRKCQTQFFWVFFWAYKSHSALLIKW